MSETVAMKLDGGALNRGGCAGSLGPLRALALANLRFWPTVAPVAGRELSRWREAAEAIEDGELRALAIEKLEQEAFNAQVASTLATLAPKARRAQSVEAIIALELLFDYLDGRTEQLEGEAVGHGPLLFAPLREALVLEAEPRRGEQEAKAELAADCAYLNALSQYTRERFRALPGARSVVPVAGAALERCAQAQLRIHAVPTRGVEQLREWSLAGAEGTGLGWREYAAGCASSVLAAHALVATATRENVSEADARGIDAAYLTVGAAITILDSLVDEAEDRAQGRFCFTSLYAPGELAETMPALLAFALARARAARDGDHHAMTLAGVAAYYTSHPGARRGQAPVIAGRVRAELSPTVWPALAVMRTWRAAKRARGLLRGTSRTVAGVRARPPRSGQA